MSDVPPDAEIQIGDVCIDLVERGKVQVVAVAADSVEEHKQFNSYDVADYKANALLDVRDDEPVYRCVYLTENPSVSFSGTYDFPGSRLARSPVEEANEDLQRVQWEWAVHVLKSLFLVASRSDMPGSVDMLADLAAHAGVDDDVLEVARELGQAPQSEEVDVDVE